MTPERWAQIEELFHRVAECDPTQRTALLDQGCANDLELRQHVEALLSSDKGARSNMHELVRSEFKAVAFSLTGETISHYRILDGLGSGGMGVVYRAQDLRLSRHVALKFLPEESAKNPDALRRFEREARSASALEHVNICSIYEFGEHEGQRFIVMPLLEGQTVEQFIHIQKNPKGSQQMQKLIDLSIQVLKGLGAAHEHGIVHRDIKPGNVFLTSSGEAKILDFGVAKLTEIEEQVGQYAISESETVTLSKGSNLSFSRTGVIIGTAAYMSPEQVRGERVDARTDIFSFGLVLYELATGKRAFAGTTWPVLQEAVLRGTPKPARRLNPTIPVKLENIINKAIQKAREARYQTAAEMRAELEGLQRELSPKHLPRAWIAGLAAACLIVVGIMAFLLKRQHTDSVTPEIKLRQLTTNSSENPVSGGAISPDGRYLAYIDTRGLQLKAIDTGEVRAVPLPAELNDPQQKWEFGAWFPDSTRLIMNLHPATEGWNEWSSASATVWVISILGGNPIKIRDHGVASSISPDGSAISFATNKGKRGEREIWLMGLNGEEPRKFLAVDGDNAICCFGWSPDGKRYGYVLTDSSGDKMLSRDVNGGSPVTLLGNAELQKMDDINWLHDGRVVYSLHETHNGNACNYWTVRLDLATGRRLEQPRRLTNWPNFCVFSGSVTNNDKQLAFVATSNFYTSYVGDIDARGTRIRNLRHFTLEDADDVITDWTADGKAVIVVQNRTDRYSLYKQRVDSEIPETIVSSAIGGVATFALTTPDSKWIIALIWPVSEGKALERPNVPLPIVRIPLSGGTPETILRVSRPSPVSCARPPSDMCVIIEQTDNSKQMIVSAFDAIKGRGTELGRFTLARDVDLFVDNLLCAISPDGTRLAIARSPESSVEIYSIRGKPIAKISSASSGKLISLLWAPDQRGVFVTRKTENGTELLHLDLKGHVESLRKCVGGWACFGFPSPDGRHVAILENNSSKNIWMMENF